jgi:hypothetical protein
MGPAMDDRVAVEVIKVDKDPCLEFILGWDANSAKHRPRRLGEEAFHQIEPGAVLRGEHKGETALCLSCQPRLGLLGYMRGVVVEDQLDNGVCRLGSIEFLVSNCTACVTSGDS